MVAYFARPVNTDPPDDDPSRKKQLAVREVSVNTTFRIYLLPVLLDVAEVAATAYAPWLGAPTCNLLLMIGVWILQEMNGWTIDKALYHYWTNPDVRGALGLPEKPTDDDAYFSRRTYCSFRKKFVGVGGPRAAFVMLTFHMLKVAGVDTSIIRIDSTDVMPNIDMVTRYGLIRETVSFFMRQFMKEFPLRACEVDSNILSRYDAEKKIGYGPEFQVGRSVTDGMILVMARDAESLVRQFAGDRRISGMETFQILQRLVREQCDVVPGKDGGEPEVSLKPSKDVGGDSLQSPYDTGAGYDGHKDVKGYKGQTAETCPGIRKSKLRRAVLNLVIYIRTEGANVSDVHAIPAILEFLR
jgi:hypothetical protein